MCRVLISGGAKVEHRVPEPKTSIYVQCSFCLKMAAHKVRCPQLDVNICLAGEKKRPGSPALTATPELV